MTPLRNGFPGGRKFPDVSFCKPGFLVRIFTERQSPQEVAMVKELRKSQRIDFERGVDVQIMGIDGTWRRACRMLDVSEGGALLQVQGSVGDLDLKEFFLVLSSTGLAYRRCKMVRVNGDQIGVIFLKCEMKKKATSPSARRAPVEGVS